MSDAAMAGAAQGAAAGATFGPWGAVIGGVAGYVLADQSKAQPGGGAAGPAPGGASSSAAAKATYGNSNLNADNWSVNFSGTQTNSPVADHTIRATQSADAQATAATAGPGALMGSLPAGMGGAAGGLNMTYVAIGVAALAVLWKLSHK